MMNRQNRMYPSLHVSKFIISLIKIVVPAIIFITFLHNASLARETRSRDLIYATWVNTVRDSDMFEDVKDKDALISRSQNDAYESNAGYFYFLTGKRLTYIYQPQNLWPEINDPNCTLDKQCILPPASTRVANVIPNLLRNNGFSSPLPRTAYGDDWINQLMKPGSLLNIRFFLFELIPMTSDSIASFLIPLNSSEKTDYLNLLELKFIVTSRLEKKQFTPSLNGICLIQTSDVILKHTAFGPLYVTNWNIPNLNSIQKSRLEKNLTSIDIRNVNLGTCG